MRGLAFAFLGSIALAAVHPDPRVETFHDITYSEGRPEDLHKHQLDLYLPKGRNNFPVFVFVHGGFWSAGDRARYRTLGNYFAQAGVGVVIPSYRLMPAHPHPAQIEDVAAAFAWTVNHIASYGGDAKRIFLGGHSAGGHLAALLALDARFLGEHSLTPASIRGVVSISGVYDVRAFMGFGLTPRGRRDASPLQHTSAGAPPFLLTYCQWDYAGLPLQARKFAEALRATGVSASLVRIPGKNHVTEILSVGKPGDRTAAAVLDFIARL
jgi:acetyl esterase/lipase